MLSFEVFGMEPAMFRTLEWVLAGGGFAAEFSCADDTFSFEGTFFALAPLGGLADSAFFALWASWKITYTALSDYIL